MSVYVWPFSFSVILLILFYSFGTLIKGKTIPLQAWSGPEGSRKLRFPDFITMAQDGGKVVSLMNRPPLPPGNTPGTHFWDFNKMAENYDIPFFLRKI
jgi:hypothetical protein